MSTLFVAQLQKLLLICPVEQLVERSRLARRQYLASADQQVRLSGPLLKNWSFAPHQVTSSAG
jgi:hypothetical protein